MKHKHPIFIDYFYDDESEEIYCEYLDRVITPTKHSSGYMVFMIEDFIKSKIKSYRVHKFIMECILGREIKEGYVVNHIDGNKANNKLSNLEEITSSANTLHAYENGLAKAKKGEEHLNAKLKEEEVKNIFEMRANGNSVRNIASYYNVSVKTIYSILSKKRWKHLIKD